METLAHTDNETRARALTPDTAVLLAETLAERQDQHLTRAEPHPSGSGLYVVALYRPDGGTHRLIGYLT